ncbi:MAG: hypothetical protein RR413_09210 [Christensenellaceae bacterium]
MEITIRFLDNRFSFENWTAILTAVTAVMAIVISIITYRSQVKHNKNSVKPILNISVGDYVNEIFIKVKNKGVGPATITLCNCIQSIDNRIRKETAVINYFDDVHFVWDTFANDITNLTIAPGGEMVLLRACIEDTESMNAIRKQLRNIEIQIEYIDIYNEKMPVARKQLTWFGRTLE